MFMPVCPKCGEHRDIMVITEAGPTAVYGCRKCGHEFASDPRRAPTFVVIREPGRVGTNAPSRTYGSYDQATTVAAKMAKEHRDTFYVARLVARVELVEVKIEALP